MKKLLDGVFLSNGLDHTAQSVHEYCLIDILDGNFMVPLEENDNCS